MPWQGVDKLEERTYRCWNCDTFVSSSLGWFNGKTTKQQVYEDLILHICPKCALPTLFGRRSDYSYVQIPPAKTGSPISGLPDDVAGLYREACAAAAANAHTAAVMVCRKLLANIAVGKGADKGLQFLPYVKWLVKKGWVPPDGEGWVDHIRDKGNEANHEIALMDADASKLLIEFAEMLLRFIYEFPAKVPAPKPKPDSKS